MRALLAAMALAVVSLVLAGAAQAQCSGTSCTVTTAADTLGGPQTSLRDAITYADSNPGTTITIQSGLGTITLGSNLPLVAQSTTIIGNNNTIDGVSTYRGFLISGIASNGINAAATTVAISNLTIQNVMAQGGAGTTGGGGGLGAGGAVFIGPAANVTLTNVAIVNAQAVGGAGSTQGLLGGGGGGLGGNGGAAFNQGGGGGGGLFFGGGTSNSGGSAGGGGGGGITTAGANGTPFNGGNGGAGVNGNGGGGGGGANGGTVGAAGGVGATSGNGTSGGNGGFGGGGSGDAGGTPGSGGFGGGGGGARIQTGGAGGFGGGGGGAGFGSGTGGTGGFGGGGGAGATSGFGAGAASQSQGGGGAAMGGAVFVVSGGSLTINGTGSVSGGSVTGGASSSGNGSAFGSGLFLQGNGTLSFTPGSGNTQIISDVIADEVGVVTNGYSPPAGTYAGTESWNLTKSGAGTLVLTAANLYSGGTTINGGTLEVDGSIAASNGVAVNTGATLDGAGLVSAVTVNSGGLLAPGRPGSIGTLTGTGNLLFNAGSFYLVAVNGIASSLFSTAGSATLNSGTKVNVASGSNIVAGDKYTILTATGGITGVFDPTVRSGDFVGTLSYDADDAYLTFAFVPPTISGLLPPNASVNVTNVANAIDGFVNAGGTLPAQFQNLLNLTPPQLQTALTQLSGEAATDAQKGGFQLMNEFLGLMVDPFVDGRGSVGGVGGGMMTFAPEQAARLPSDVALAYAEALKAPVYKAPTFEQRWSVWGASYGGSSTTNGDPALGSNDVTARTFGSAGGVDYHVSRDTVLGFALAGGGTNWGLAQGLGGGRSDAFQAGVYGKTYIGAAYLAADFAFTDHWMTTSRTAAFGDQLTASFNGQSFGGRIEAGYRYGMPAIGVSPYAALQAQSFHTPAYSETDLTGGGFGLAYNSMTADDTRSELGARFDAGSMLGTMPLILRGRVAWAHDWVTNPALTAVFQSLPGASFVVNGAGPSNDSALASAGAELHVGRNWTASAKFDGEFASRAQTYAGTGTLRYSW